MCYFHEDIDYYKKENNEILICMLIGGIFYIIYILMRKFIFGGFSEIDPQSTMNGKIMTYILFNVFVGTIFFVLPFGWNVLRKHLNIDKNIYLKLKSRILILEKVYY